MEIVRSEIQKERVDLCRLVFSQNPTAIIARKAVKIIMEAMLEGLAED